MSVTLSATWTTSDLQQVLVMGGYWGSGTRGGIIGSFVCGVVDKEAAGGPRYLSFCKVGSGFSLEDFAHMG